MIRSPWEKKCLEKGNRLKGNQNMFTAHSWNQNFDIVAIYLAWNSSAKIYRYLRDTAFSYRDTLYACSDDNLVSREL